MEQAQQTGRHAHRQMVAALILSWLVACGVSAYALYQSHHQAQINSEKTVSNLTLSLENFLQVHFGVADLILQQAVRKFQQDATPPVNTALFSKKLGDLQQILPNIVGVRGSNAQGEVIYGINLPTGKPLSISGRKFFEEAKNSGELIFGLPLKSRVTGDWVLPMARSLVQADGTFSGVVYVNTDFQKIASTFESIDVGKHGTVALFDADRRIHLRLPSPPALQDEQVLRFEAPETRNAIAQGRTEAVYQTTSSIDGLQRTVGFRQVGDYPLYVLVSLSKDEYLAEWRSDVRAHVILLLLLAATCAVFSVALKRSWQTREIALMRTMLKESELENTVEALSTSEERFRTLTEGLPQMSWSTDAQRKIQYLSRQWSDFTGRSLPTLLHAEAWLDCVHPEDRCHIQEAWERALATGETYRTKARIRRHDGVWRTFDCTALPQRNAAGNIVGWVGSNIDITESEEAQLKQAIAMQAAEAANLAKSAFLANMSHEIRTPINGILGMSHLMRRDHITPLQAQRLDKIAASGKHLLDVINNILDLSKIEAGKLTLEEEDFTLAQLLQDIHAVIGESIRSKGLSLNIDMKGMPQFLHADATKLRQALVNYLSNALKFTQHGAITLRGRVLEENAGNYLLRFEVSDTGIGITAEQKGRLFQAFEQADKSTTRKYGGTGLGLAINQSIARLMGGEVGVDSMPNQGSTFWLTVRLRQGQKSPARAIGQVAENAETAIRNKYRGKRILIAEDEPINQEVAAELLRDVGLEPLIANNGAEALRMAGEENYALILMDMQMPEMDGIKATIAIRKLPGRKTVPILAMTANAFDEDREKCFKAGMNDFVPKAIDPDVLFASLLKWLAQPQTILGATNDQAE